MSDLLIPHMKLPEGDKTNVVMFDPQGNVCEQSKHFSCYHRFGFKAQEIPDHGDLIDRKNSVERFEKLSEAYDLALQDCDLEKEVYPHYGALMRGKKAVVDMAIRILLDMPVVVKASEE